MKKYINKYALAVLGFSAFLSACDPEIDAPSASAGEANFSKYVALGNSLTAGFADAALYRAGQEVSYPSILAKQFKMVGFEGEFKQPLITVGTAGDIGIGSSLNSRLVLAPNTDCKGVTSLGPKPAKMNNAGTASEGDLSIFHPSTFVNAQGPFNNLGVPGAKSFHLLSPSYGDPAGLAANPRTANPFYVRFAGSSSTSVLAAAVSQQPTFFTLWIGNNDILENALSGGMAPPTPKSGAPGVGFDGTMTALVNTLTSGGAKGAIANIPDVTKIPYFTTVPYNGLVLTEQAQVNQLNSAYSALNIKFSLGPNPFIIKDNVPGGRRQMKPGELVLLSVSQDSLKCKGLGSAIGISNKDVLTESEIAVIKDYVSSYNATILALANSKGLAHVDANQYLSELAMGKTENTINYSASFVTGNVFSLDGIHFTPRGNAIVANEFIKAINSEYNASIPQVDITDYKTVVFP